MEAMAVSGGVRRTRNGREINRTVQASTSPPVQQHQAPVASAWTQRSQPPQSAEVQRNAEDIALLRTLLEQQGRQFNAMLEQQTRMFELLTTLVENLPQTISDAVRVDISEQTTQQEMVLEETQTDPLQEQTLAPSLHEQHPDETVQVPMQRDHQEDSLFTIQEEDLGTFTGNDHDQAGDKQHPINNIEGKYATSCPNCNVWITKNSSEPRCDSIICKCGAHVCMYCAKELPIDEAKVSHHGPHFTSSNVWRSDHSRVRSGWCLKRMIQVSGRTQPSTTNPINGRAQSRY